MIASFIKYDSTVILNDYTKFTKFIDAIASIVTVLTHGQLKI